MDGAGPGLVLAAGTVTFGNEWIQTGKANWRVPVATLIAAWVFTGIDRISSGASTGLGALAFITALSVSPSGAKSPLTELQSISKG